MLDPLARAADRLEELLNTFDDADTDRYLLVMTRPQVGYALVDLLRGKPTRVPLQAIADVVSYHTR
ncbi:MAG TPA: hypothetical protein VI172_08385 [Candidatus Dormibacteraeota bacterium]|jgi:hypothetical protein